MNLVFLYGPPAAGKTTVGKLLAAQTGYRFFFNHLTVPAAKAIFPDSQHPHPDPRHTQLLHRLRLDCLTAAANAGFDTIFTLAYSGESDDVFVAQIADTFISKGGSVFFVELHAPADTLLQRVANADRSALHLGKVTEPAHLQAILAGQNVYASVNFPNILKLDTTQYTPAQAALEIMKHIALRAHND